MMIGSDIRNEMSVREQIIEIVSDSPSSRDRYIAGTRGMLVGLISSEEKMVVSRHGMSSIHLYIKTLENIIAKKHNLEPAPMPGEKKVTKIRCERCLQTGMIRIKGKRSLVFGPCTECGGSGYKLIEEDEDDGING